MGALGLPAAATGGCLATRASTSSPRNGYKQPPVWTRPGSLPLLSGPKSASGDAEAWRGAGASPSSARGGRAGRPGWTRVSGWGPGGHPQETAIVPAASLQRNTGCQVLPQPLWLLGWQAGPLGWGCGPEASASCWTPGPSSWPHSHLVQHCPLHPCQGGPAPRSVGFLPGAFPPSVPPTHGARENQS